MKGLLLTQSGKVIRGLTISGFGNLFGNASGIQLAGASNAVEGCLIAGIFGNGILINNTADNRIGGASAMQRSKISGNTGRGVMLAGTNAAGNFVGAASAGLSAFPNTTGGIIISNAPFNRVGGAPVTRNLIGGNSGPGVEITGPGAQNNCVQANFIGVTHGGGALSNNGAGY